MTWQASKDPTEHDGKNDPVEALIVPRVRDIGDFTVRRALPARQRQMVGPFIFLDQMGPVTFVSDQAMDVRPHPHIGLSTITWLFAGEIRHRDSLGSDLTIRPGEVNWMTAGSGIVHSERSPQSSRGTDSTLAGIQTWVALPSAREEMAPAFVHYPASEIPHLDDKGMRIALIAGSAFGKRSPVLTASETLYAEVKLEQGGQLSLPVLAEEQALYLYSGELDIAGAHFKAGTLIVLRPEATVLVKALQTSCFMLLGGDGLDGPRYIDWNFVSSRKERIEQARDDWREQRFARVPGDELEYIALPENVREAE
ncbi:MAG: pirin family protein [Pseudomonadales bacterium]|nr:pirin family protein [Pseudomonadales bacterium]